MSLHKDLLSPDRRDQSNVHELSRSNNRSFQDPSSSDGDQRSSRNTSIPNPIQNGLIMRDQAHFDSLHEHHGREERSVQPDRETASVMREFLESDEPIIWPEEGHSTGNDVTVMRKVLESDEEFIWPEERHSTGSHSERPSLGLIPLKGKGNASDTSAASADEYMVSSNEYYQQPFTIKPYFKRSTSDQRQMATNELSAMKDIRHPHVAARLATFTYQGKFNILTFPCATCDLNQLLKSISKDLRGVLGESLRSYVSGHVIGHEKRPKDHHFRKQDAWPLNTSLEHKMELLRGYFVCLSQGLSYIHESSGSREDVRPTNILIDQSGNVLLPDFTIPTFGQSHRMRRSHMYDSPEALKGDAVVEASDVFSLGCIFLEMATLLLGHDLKKSSSHGITIPSINTDLGEAYSHNLRKIHSWIDLLKEKHSSLTTESCIADGLTTIRSMLDEDPQARPISRNLWMQFRSISPRICPVCDPRHPDAWRSNKDPEQTGGLDSFPEKCEALDSHDNESEVSSILSVKAPSIFSDQTHSSTTDISEDQGAPEEFAKALLTDEIMAPLYITVLHRIDVGKLERNLVRLLKSYANDLRGEATTELERTAAKFARRYAQSVASHVCESLDPSRNSRYLTMRLLSEQALRNKEDIEQYLQQVAKSDTHSDFPDTPKALQDNTVKLAYMHSDDSESDESDRPGLPNLKYVENFMTKSQAYAKLRENFQAFAAPVYELRHQGRANRELEGEHPALASSSDNTGRATENREETYVDQVLTEDHVEPVSSSDGSNDTTDTHSTTSDSTESQKTNISIASDSEDSSKAPWYDRSFKISQGVISLIAEFLGLWEKPVENGFVRVRWTCVCLRARTTV